MTGPPQPPPNLRPRISRQRCLALIRGTLVTGMFGAATGLGAVLLSCPSLIAVILKYVKRRDVRGTWLESHVPVANAHVLVWPALVLDGLRLDSRGDFCELCNCISV